MVILVLGLISGGSRVRRGDCRYGWIGVEIKIDGAPELSG